MSVRIFNFNTTFCTGSSDRVIASCWGCSEAIKEVNNWSIFCIFSRFLLDPLGWFVRVSLLFLDNKSWKMAFQNREIAAAH